MMVCLICGCTEQEKELSEYPEISTISVTDIDSTGATFSGKFITNGTSTINTYGFYWNNAVPEAGTSDSVILGYNYSKGIFKTRIDHSLARNVFYNVRAFVKTDRNIVYGDIVQFKSKGSAKGKWSLEHDMFYEGISSVLAYSTNLSGYITFRSGQLYIYDPLKKISKRGNDMPIPSNTTTRIIPVFAGNNLYIFSENKNKLFRLKDEYWTEQSTLPFKFYMFGEHMQPAAVSDTIYLVCSVFSYRYDVKNNIWTERKPLDLEQTYTRMGTSLGKMAYIISSNNSLWQYDTSSENLAKISVYPGIIKTINISAGCGNKLFFGYSQEQAGKAEFILWCYDTISRVWFKADKFPVLLEDDYRDMFAFPFGEKLYIGILSFGQYRIWEYDPSK